MPIVVSLFGFGILVLSSRKIGEWFPRIQLPLISGYMFTGILIGPFVLNLIRSEDVGNLLFLDEISLAFIAFAAGNELFLKELKGRFRSIISSTTFLAITVYTLGTLAVFLLADSIPFMDHLPPMARLAIAILAGAILIARSPSSAIAIVNELRAKGPFTKTVLGVTVLMDMVVIFFFAINASIADILLTAETFDIGFIVLLILELALTIIAGYVVFLGLRVILSAHSHRYIKSTLILSLGYGTFLLSNQLRHYTHAHLSFEILLEPLLICMVASFLVTNYSRYRDELRERLHDLGTVVYAVFFTLVGVTLRLDILQSTFFIALAIFAVRLTGIFIGSFTGGVVAGEPMARNRIAWMTYITQAGVGLGLAKEVAVEFPEVGEGFSTLIIAVIVLSQLIGPVFFKFAIRHVGEAHEPGQPEPDQIRDALILGIDDQSIALARQLKSHNWQVIVADIDESHVDGLRDVDIDGRFIPDINETTMSALITKSTDALVVMCGDDALNYRACELTYEKFGISRIIVRVNDVACALQFRALGALVVEPASAMVNLLDQFVRAPQTASLFMHRDPEHELVQVTVTDPDVDGLPLRDLRLPGSILVLGIMRDGHSIVPHGHTLIRLRDEVTLIGHPKNLDEVVLRLGY